MTAYLGSQLCFVGGSSRVQWGPLPHSLKLSMTYNVTAAFRLATGCSLPMWQHASCTPTVKVRRWGEVSLLGKGKGPSDSHQMRRIQL